MPLARRTADCWPCSLPRTGTFRPPRMHSPRPSPRRSFRGRAPASPPIPKGGSSRWPAIVCAHPALDAGIRTPLMLQTVLGLESAQIASAFAVPEATMAQRLVRAKRRIEAISLSADDAVRRSRTAAAGGLP